MATLGATCRAQSRVNAANSDRRVWELIAQTFETGYLSPRQQKLRCKEDASSAVIHFRSISNTVAIKARPRSGR